MKMAKMLNTDVAFPYMCASYAVGSKRQAFNEIC